MDFHDSQDLIKALNRVATALEGIEKKLDGLDGLEKHLSGIDREIGELRSSYDAANDIKSYGG